MGDVPTPANILRGHKAQVHAAAFLRHNERLATGDADGYVTLWDLTIMRPRAVWRAHESALLAVKGWGDRIITHGRDHKLIVWTLGEEDEERMSTVLPVEAVTTPRPQPWMLHLLHVNTMNFCAFGSCEQGDELLIAVPHSLESESIDIYTLPSQTRLYTINPGKGNGMAMSLALINKDALTLIAAFENGYASVHRLQDSQWIMTYRTQAHTQPVLSLAVHPSYEWFLTSAADAIIAKHPIPTAEVIDSEARVVEVEDESQIQPQGPIKTVNTKHAGQQGLEIRSDGRIFATAGWDSHIRVYSCKTLKELAVLQWHKVGCYAVAFAAVEETSVEQGLVSVKDRRIAKARTAHWIAAGAKDGKISLWDIY